MASCITPIPIPDMPNPQIMYKVKSNQALVTKPVESMINGTKNKDNINMVFKTILALAFLLKLFSLKYKLTRLLNVFEKSLSVTLENFGFSIVLLVLLICGI